MTHSETEWGSLGQPADSAGASLVYAYQTPLGDVRHAVYEAGASIPAYRLEHDTLVYTVGGPCEPSAAPRRLVFHPAHSLRSGAFLGQTHVISIDASRFDPFKDFARPKEAAGLSGTLYWRVWQLTMSIHERRQHAAIGAAFSSLWSHAVQALQRETSPRLNLIFDHLHRNWRQSPSANAMAELCGLSPEHFCRTFKKETGLTCRRYNTLLRVEYARTLLVGSALPIDDIASASGFADQSHLTRTLGAHVLATPARIRRETRQRQRIPLFLDDTAEFV